MAKAVNCRADYVFQHDLQVPVLTTGIQGAPTLGAVTSIVVRLSATKDGAAIHAAVGTLAASERSLKPGRFYVPVDATLLTTHVLPLGAGASFFAIWSKTGDFDLESFEFQVADGTYQ